MSWLAEAQAMVATHAASPAYHASTQSLAMRFFASECFALSMLYIVSQPFLRRYFLTSQSYVKHKAWWKTVMFAYNRVMAVYSAITFGVCAYVLYHYQLYTNDCNHLFSSDLFRAASFAFYLSKFVEYADTLFLLVMKPDKPVSYLQWIHHIGAAMNMWLGYAVAAEAVWIFVTLNSFIHTIMYLYFAESVYGRQILPKQLITSMQIVQFLTGFRLLWAYKDVECFREDPERMLGVFYFTYLYVGTVLFLFINFFLKNYIMPSKRQEGEGGAKHAKQLKATKTSSNGVTTPTDPAHTNGHTTGGANGYTNGHTEGRVDGYGNGHKKQE